MIYQWANSSVNNVKRQSNPITGLDRPRSLQEVEAPRFQDNRHMNVASLSALRTGSIYLPGNISGTHFCYRLSRRQGHSAAGRIMSMKISNHTIWNRISYLPTCSTVPQPTAPRRNSVSFGKWMLMSWNRNCNSEINTRMCSVWCT